MRSGERERVRKAVIEECRGGTMRGGGKKRENGVRIGITALRKGACLKYISSTILFFHT